MNHRRQSETVGDSQFTTLTTGLAVAQGKSSVRAWRLICRDWRRHGLGCQRCGSTGGVI